MLGLGGFANGGRFNKNNSNKLMRYRIGAQFIAVVLIVIYVYSRRTGGLISMVVLNKIYTKTGDAGETALGNGARVAKHAMRVDRLWHFGRAERLCRRGAAGCVGRYGYRAAAASRTTCSIWARTCAARTWKKTPTPNIRRCGWCQSQVTRLEREIDVMNADLEPLRSFILPGGSALAAHLHVCRTVARRAERLASNWPRWRRSTRRR